MLTFGIASCSAPPSKISILGRRTWGGISRISSDGVRKVETGQGDPAWMTMMSLTSLVPMRVFLRGAVWMHTGRTRNRSPRALELHHRGVVVAPQ